MLVTGKESKILGNYPSNESLSIEPLSEIYLRKKILDELSNLDPKDKQIIINAFEKYKEGIDKKQILNSLAKAVLSAAKGTEWKTGGSTLQMGFYNTQETFYTLIFHEAAHVVLQSLGRTDKEYDSTTEQEEDFCWRFSRLACNLLNFPYSLLRESISRSFCELKLLVVKKLLLNPEEQLKALSQLIVLEQQCFNFSDVGKDRFYWVENSIPLKLRDE
jgi:hypothetical protein